jgi:hypothetical protein
LICSSTCSSGDDCCMSTFLHADHACMMME